MNDSIKKVRIPNQFESKVDFEHIIRTKCAEIVNEADLETLRKMFLIEHMNPKNKMYEEIMSDDTLYILGMQQSTEIKITVRNVDHEVFLMKDFFHDMRNILNMRKYDKIVEKHAYIKK